MANKRDRQKIIILFAGTHLAYSPTITQLYDALAEIAEVTILAEIVPHFIPQKLTGRNVIYYEEGAKKKPSFLKKIHYFLLRRFNGPAKRLEAAGLKLKNDYDHFCRVKDMIRTGKYDRIIAVDLQNLFYCTALNLKADFVSLELAIGEHFLPFIDRKLINCVITQNPERFDYYFKGENIPKFLIQNAPVYTEHQFPDNKKGLLFGGTAWNPFGIFHALEYLRKYRDIPLTVQGAFPEAEKRKAMDEYPELFAEKLIIVNDTYLDNDEVVGYFSHFEIGLCLYNYEVEWMKHFNYQTAPSGKLFKYLAGGVPVLAINVIGFKFIEEMQCGVLIDNLQPESIRAGILKIRSRYSYYEANTKIAAAHYSFDKAVKPYIDYVISSSE